MKQSYVAPGIFFQSLNANGLSAACAYQATHAANVCPLRIAEWNGETIFSDYSICMWTPDDRNVCYDVPTGTNNVFES